MKSITGERENGDCICERFAMITSLLVSSHIPYQMSQCTHVFFQNLVQVFTNCHFTIYSFSY
jgi:hypothetical protein